MSSPLTAEPVLELHYRPMSAVWVPHDEVPAEPGWLVVTWRPYTGMLLVGTVTRDGGAISIRDGHPRPAEGLYGCHYIRLPDLPEPSERAAHPPLVWRSREGLPGTFAELQDGRDVGVEEIDGGQWVGLAPTLLMSGPDVLVLPSEAAAQEAVEKAVGCAPRW